MDIQTQTSKNGLSNQRRNQGKKKNKEFYTRNILQFKVEYRNTPPQIIVSKVNTFIQKLRELGLQQDIVLSWKDLPDPSPVWTTASYWYENKHYNQT